MGSGQDRLYAPEPGAGRATEDTGQELGDHSGSRDQPIAAPTLLQHKKKPPMPPYLPPPLPLRPFNSSSDFKKGPMGVKTEGSGTCSQPVTQVAGGAVLSRVFVVS